MTTSYLRLWYRFDGTWHNRVYATEDPEWRSAFTSLSGSRYNVRIEYLHDRPTHDGTTTYCQAA
jgi:hypothetical protein